MKLFRPLFFFLIIVFVAIMAPVAHAFEVRGGEFITVPTGQVVRSTLFAGGSSVVVEGTVEGDVFCGGSHVVITGTVTGDVLCAAQNVQIDGIVQGDVRLVGQSLGVSGKVQKNASRFGQSILIAKAGTVSGELLAGGQSLVIDGTVTKGVIGGGQSMTINGRVGGDAKVMAESLALGEGAAIAGNLAYTSEKEAMLPKGATVSGTISRDIPKKNLVNKPKSRKAVSMENKPWPANALPGIFFYVLIAAVVVAIFPARVGRVIGMMKEEPVGVGLKGFLVLIGVPMAIMFFFITIIGIPLAVLLGVAYAFAIAISRIFPAIAIGGYILTSFFPKRKETFLIDVLVGVPILWFITKAPFVGGIISFLVVLWGLGGMVGGWRTPKK